LRASAGSSSRAPGLPRFGRPEGPGDQHGLEEQTDAANEVGVEAEGVGAPDELLDVAGEDRDEEGGDDPADDDAPAAEDEESESERDLDTPDATTVTSTGSGSQDGT